jgi:hypothetical protein
MCLSVIGNRLCAICSLTLKDNHRLPSDRRVYECGGTELDKEGKHMERILVNYRIFVCACCKEAARVEISRKTLDEKFRVIDEGRADGNQEGKGKGLNPMAKDFEPEHFKTGRKIEWVGGWWIEA